MVNLINMNDSNKMNTEIYTQLVPLISYPELDIRSDLEKVSQSLNGEKTDDFHIFREHVNKTELTKLQEEFTQLFDFTPNTCLDLGWHLHGENYERGVFMVRVREMLREFGVSESSELPDHLTHILTVLPKMDDSDRDEFVRTRVIPATEKIIKGFGEKENPYKHLIQFIHDVLKNQSTTQEVQT